VADSLTHLAGPRVGAEGLLPAVLDATTQPVWIVDPHGVIRFADAAAVAALGYDGARELVGRRSHEAMHCRHGDEPPCPAAECPALMAQATGETIRVSQSVRDRDRRHRGVGLVAGEAHVRDWKYLPDLRHDGGEQVLRRRPMRGERSDAPQRRLLLGQPGHASPARSTSLPAGGRWPLGGKNVPLAT